MTLGLRSQSSIAEIADRVVPDVDAWRNSVSGKGSADATYKEWMHFCIRLPGERNGHLLVNVNVTESLVRGVSIRAPKLIVLAELDEWTGNIESFSSESVWGPAGGLDVRLGGNRIRWQAGSFRLSLQSSTLSAELSLRPVVMPSVSSSVSFGPDHAMHWVVLPRLETSGWVRIAGRRLTLERELAYHDHNWGHFRWGGDLSWEWGFVHPDDPSCPFNVVLLRVSDGGRHRTLAQSVLLWEGERLLRTFQNREIRVALSGSHRARRPLTLPKIASVLLPGTSSGVPATLEIVAAGLTDRFGLRFDTSSKARVAIPSDLDPCRLVLLNEASGRARVSGTTRGRSFDFAGRAMMEFVRG